MSYDNMPAAQPAAPENQFAQLRAALAGEAATPEIVAIFQQIKNLRESDRSLRSIRRNLDLDNMPTLDTTDAAASEVAVAPASELALLLDSFITLKREKDVLNDRLSQMAATTDKLESKVNQLTEILEKNVSTSESNG